MILIKQLLLSFFAITIVFSANTQPQNNDRSANDSVTVPLRIYPEKDKQLVSQNIETHKPVIDSTVLKKWVRIIDDKVAISNDGKYFWYSIRNKPLNNTTLIVQAIDNSWKKEIIGLSDGFFSGDSKQFVYANRDSIIFLKLGSRESNFIINSSSHRFPKHENGQWLCYLLKGTEKTLVVQNLLSRQQFRYNHVLQYNLDESTSDLILQVESAQRIGSLKWINLLENKITTINSWSGNPNLLKLSLDAPRKQLCWLVEQDSNAHGVSIYYYKFGMKKPVLAVNNFNREINDGLKIFPTSNVGFTKNGQYIYFELEEAESPKVKPNASQVDIWNYKDVELQSIQLLKIAKQEATTRYQSVIKVDKINAIERPGVVTILRQNEDAPFIGAWDIQSDYFLAREKKRR